MSVNDVLDLVLAMVVVGSFAAFVLAVLPSRHAATEGEADDHEPPYGLRPAHLGALVDGTVLPRHVTATAVDLAVRGHLVVERNKVVGWTMTAADVEGDEPTPYEARVLDAVAGTSTTELKFEFVARLRALRTLVRKDLRRNGWWSLVDYPVVRGSYLLGIALALTGGSYLFAALVRPGDWYVFVQSVALLALAVLWVATWAIHAGPVVLVGFVDLVAVGFVGIVAEPGDTFLVGAIACLVAGVGLVTSRFWGPVRTRECRDAVVRVETYLDELAGLEPYTRQLAYVVATGRWDAWPAANSDEWDWLRAFAQDLNQAMGAVRRRAKGTGVAVDPNLKFAAPGRTGDLDGPSGYGESGGSSSPW